MMLPTRGSLPVKDSIVVDNATSTNIKVVVRLRPPNEKEVASGKVNLIKVIDDHMLTFDPKEDEWNKLYISKQRTDKKIKDLLFAFDRVFDGNSSNDDVFESTTKTAIDSVLKGYNCSVFAYGATSAGKTHTMLGSPEKPGVIFLTMMELYKKLMLRKDDFESDISVSYLEIYNETCKDLLLPTGPLAVRENPDKGVCVNGLSLHKPQSAEELLEMLHYGNQNRTQHPTDANKQSSRSHAVFQVFVRQSQKATGLNTDVTLAKMSLIDLAGSERATVTTNQGDRLREGANINKSLLALGNCINALAENKSKIHIPYRDSKLTRLLKDSLGGNCATVMIAAVSPSVLSYEDTYNTLKYANRAKSIKATLSANTVNIDFHVTQYAKIVEDLKSQIADLKFKIENQESNSDRQSVKGSKLYKDSDQIFSILQGYEQELHVLYKERFMIKQNLVVSEASGKELSLKLLQKERNFKRLEHISELAGSVPQHAQEKLDKFRATYDTKQAHYMKQKVVFTSSLDENMAKLTKLQKEIDNWANKTDSFILMHLNMLYELKQLELKYVSVKAQCKYLRKQFPLQEADNRNNEQLIAQLLQIIASQQRKLNIQMNTSQPGIGEVYDDDVKGLPNNLIDGTKIAWADQTFTVDGCNNISTHLEVSPFKTPSKKPYVLRQMVSESRRFSDQTQRNTLLNAKSMQLINPAQLFTDVCENDVSENDVSENDVSDNDVSESVTNVEIPISSVILAAPQVNLNNTFSTKVPSMELMHSNIVCEHTVENSENVCEDFKNSGIPIRTPLQVNNENIPRIKKSHRRSMSDGHQIFQLAKSNAKRFGKIISPKKVIYPNIKSSITTKKVSKFAPTRARISHKENIPPRIKTVEASYKSLKKYKSESTLPVYKHVPVDQRTFRF